MTSRDFVYWLQGFLEVSDAGDGKLETITSNQVECIRKHLNLVFIHEIDPSMGPPEKQQALNNAHGVGDVKMRC